MPIFDPRATLPAYSEEWIRAQITFRSSLPKREVKPRYLFITGPQHVTQETLLKAHAAALSAFRLASTGWSIWLDDASLISPTVLQTCRTYQIGYRVFGNVKNPRTRVSSKFYQRLTVEDVEAYLISLADRYVALDRTLIQMRLL